ncbi:MAG: hypothetical protein FWD84_04535, partial [Oscillospiraceae bacterium]|nr:hypothetical protein [Oscillospiraceae bacterium]
MKRVLIALVLLALLSAPALAFDFDILDAPGVDELERAVPDGARDLLDGTDLGIRTSFDGALRRMFSNLLGQFGGVFRQAARSAATVMVIAMLAGLVGSMVEGSGRAVPDFVPLVGVLAVAGVAVGSSSAFIGLGANTLQELEAFSKS